MSFRNKLIAGIALTQTVILILYITVNYNALKNTQTDELEVRANSITSLLANISTTPVITADLATLEDIIGEAITGKNIHFVTITDDQGNTLVETNKHNPQNTMQHRDHLLIKKTRIGDKSLYIGEIEIGFSRQYAQEKLDLALSNQLRIGLVGLVFAMLIAYVLGTVLTRRLKLLEQGASTIRDGGLGFQLEASGQDEIGRTATAFNVMSQHVNELYNEQEKVNNLLTILNNAQTRYIQSDNPNAIFEELLNDIISITKSEYGFLGEILYTDGNKPYLHTLSITDISWDAGSKALYQNNRVKGFELYNLNTLFGSAIKSGLPVISNDPKRDPRASGTPSGHPDLNAFLGMPLYSGKNLVGLIGLANRKGGYSQKILEELQALWQVSASIIISYLAEQERKKIESELRESEERFSLVAQGTNDGMWDWNLKTGEIYYSDRWREMLCYDKTEITHRFDEWQALIHPDDLGDALNTWTECMEGKLKTFSFEYRIKDKLDVYLWILCRGTVFKNTDGKAIRMAGSHTDITTQKENEIALKESAERTQAIFDNVSDTILTLNNSGVIEECNPSIEDSFNYTPDEIIGNNISTLINIPQGTTDIDNLKKIFRINNETVGIKQGGAKFPIDIELSEITDENQDRSLVFVIRDITERKKTEAAIHKAHEAAIDAARTKSEFLANMSHEIRTPLHGILGMLQLTEKTKLDEKQEGYISTATTSANHLLSLINDILDFSKIEAGKLDLEYIPFNLREILEDVTHLYASQALSKNIQLEQLMPASINDYYYGDPARLKQIFNNLVSNAIKFTQHGSVLLKVKVLSTMKDEATLQIEVADTGIGISPQAQEKIFSSFQQADNTMARKFGGTGLGLTICKQLAELMNADLNIKSTEAKGSRFILNITMKTAKNITPYTTDPLKGRHALTLNTSEEETITNGVVIDHLTHWNLDHTHCDNLDDIFSILQIEEHIEYIFLYGTQTSTTDIKKLRKKITPETRIIVICETDSPLLENEDDSQLIYIEKPLKQSEVYNSLVQNISEDLKIYGGRRNKDGVTFQGDVLLVEDNPVNQEVSREILQHLGLHVEIAENGIEAVNAVQKRKYDLIFMDCQMPEMDGFQATIEIRKIEAEKDQPKHNIIALTANAMKGDREKCLAVDMNDYLTKPYTQETIINTLKRWLPAQSLQQDNQNTQTISEEQKDNNSMEDNDIVDFDIANGLKLILKDRFAIMIDKFEINAEKLIIEMHEAYANKDMETLRRGAHTLKGSSGTLGAKKLQKTCAELESSAKQGEIPRLEEQLADIEADYQEFKQHLPQLKTV